MTGLGDLFGELEGKEIPGGCELCDSFQTVKTDEFGVIHMTVHHDQWCPFLRSREAGAN